MLWGHAGERGMCCGGYLIFGTIELALKQKTCYEYTYIFHTIPKTRPHTV